MMPTIASSVATPMPMPSVVGTVRSRCAVSDSNAMRAPSKRSTRITRAPPCFKRIQRRRLGPGPIGDHQAVGQANGAGAARRELGLVRHQHQRVPLLVQLSEQADDLFTRRRVEISGRLVGEQQRGISSERAGDRHPLLLAARQLVRLVGHAVLELHGLERFDRLEPPLFRANAAVHQRQLDVGQRRLAGQQLKVLEDEADLAVADIGELIIVHVRDVFAIQLVAAARGRVEAPHHVHQRALARARLADDRDPLAALDAEIDTPAASACTFSVPTWYSR